MEIKLRNMIKFLKQMLKNDIVLLFLINAFLIVYNVVGFITFLIGALAFGSVTSDSTSDFIVNIASIICLILFGSIKWVTLIKSYSYIEKNSQNIRIKELLNKFHNDLKYKIIFLLILSIPFLIIGICLIPVIFKYIYPEQLIANILIYILFCIFCIFFMLTFYLVGDYLVLFLWWEAKKFFNIQSKKNML